MNERASEYCQRTVCSPILLLYFSLLFTQISLEMAEKDRARERSVSLLS